MKRSHREDAKLGEARAVLLRLKQFSADPDADFTVDQTETEAPVRSRGVAIAAVSAAAGIALIAAGTFAFLGLSRPVSTSMVSSAPKLPIQGNPLAGAALDSGQSAGIAIKVSTPKLTDEDRARAERFLVRGDEYLADGNVIAARGFFERAADVGLAAGAFRLASTYDPGELQRLHAQVVPDPALARKWYERARDLGAPEAAMRLATLSQQ